MDQGQRVPQRAIPLNARSPEVKATDKYLKRDNYGKRVPVSRVS